MQILQPVSFEVPVLHHCEMNNFEEPQHMYAHTFLPCKEVT